MNKVMTLALSVLLLNGCTVNVSANNPAAQQCEKQQSPKVFNAFKLVKEIKDND